MQQMTYLYEFAFSEITSAYLAEQNLCSIQKKLVNVVPKGLQPLLTGLWG